jgi:hypothetical protein
MTIANIDVSDPRLDLRRLPYWERYETDDSFADWIDSGEYAPAYSLARFVGMLPRPKPGAILA